MVLLHTFLRWVFSVLSSEMDIYAWGAGLLQKRVIVQLSQDIYCHIYCLKYKMHPPVHMRLVNFDLNLLQPIQTLQVCSSLCGQ